MRIALVQHKASADVGANLRRGLDAARAAADDGAELVVFAELAFTPFYPRQRATPERLDRAEPVPGPTTEAFQELARERAVTVVLNLFERAGERTFDASPVIDADGRLVGVTRMLHITDYPGFHEQGYYAPGPGGVGVHETRAGRIGVCICYDRHYPEVLRALALAGADLVVVPQAGALDEWPDGMFEAEMRAAAFQNGFFVALCNRVGVEDDLHFAGESFVCDARGSVIARAARDSEDVLITDLDLSSLESSPARQLFLGDRRPELYADWFGDGRCEARHLLATLAYRFQRAVHGADDAFGSFQGPAEVRPPREIVRHMSHVIGFACRSFAPDRSLELEELDWSGEIARFHATLEELDEHFASRRSPKNVVLTVLLQGPVADAMTHIGQISMLRRMAGSPVAGRSFMTADVRMGRVGPDQNL